MEKYIRRKSIEKKRYAAVKDNAKCDREEYDR